MKLIEALIMVQQEYGIYGDWKAIHSTNAYIGRGPYGNYLAIDREEVFSQSDRLETVISNFAEKYPHAVLDEQWKVSRWT